MNPFRVKCTQAGGTLCPRSPSPTVFTFSLSPSVSLSSLSAISLPCWQWGCENRVEIKHRGSANRRCLEPTNAPSKKHRARTPGYNYSIWMPLRAAREGHTRGQDGTRMWVTKGVDLGMTAINGELACSLP